MIFSFIEEKKKPRRDFVKQTLNWFRYGNGLFFILFILCVVRNTKSQTLLSELFPTSLKIFKKLFCGFLGRVMPSPFQSIARGSKCSESSNIILQNFLNYLNALFSNKMEFYTKAQKAVYSSLLTIYLPFKTMHYRRGITTQLVILLG